MNIVIVDSGVSERYKCNQICFPLCSNEDIPKVVSGHGTAIYNIINSRCSDFAEIINFRLLNIENGIDENTLISALSYIYESIHPDIINLSLGVSECNHIQELYDVCSKLTSEGTIIVSAFDNAGSISYPAAFNNVIGVVNRNSCHKVDDFEYFEDQVVNVGAKGSLQRLAWDNPQSVFLSGNSFACAHTTAKIAEMMFFSRKKLTKEQLLNNFKKISIKNNDSLNVFSMQKLPFNINVAALFPFGKEMQNLVRYERLLNFKIADIYETRYSAKIGATTNHLLNAN